MVELLDQAREALCGGEVNFVFTTSPATDTMQAAKSFAYSGDITWTYE